MKILSIFDKIKVVFNITMSDKIYLVIMALLAFLSILFATTNRKNAKESKKTYGIIYIVAIVAIIIKYYSSLGTMYDEMMNNLFIVFYFPNISVYLAAIITTNIIMWISMFSKKAKRITKIINSIVFFLLHYILILVLSIVSNSNLDVFDSVKLYQNSDIHSLIELSSNIFILWIIYLIIYKAFMTYFEKKELKKAVVTSVASKKVVTKNMMPYYVNVLDAPMAIRRDKNTTKVNNKLDSVVTKVNAPFIVKRDAQENRHYPSYIRMIDSPVIVKRDRTATKIVYTTPVTKTTQVYEPNLSQEDYKVVLNILRQQKNNRVVTKEEEKRIEKDNQEKLSQLMELYRAV